MVIVAGVVYLIVVGTLLIATFRRRSPAETRPEDADTPRPVRRTIAAAIAATAVVLVLLLAADFATGSRLEALRTPERLTIEVTGHQWWWEVVYTDSHPPNTFTTANEIHIPVGRPVELILGSRDVIHSFWIPALHGKKDLIPGYRISHWIQADRPGVYDGQCAEFCGIQHAHMRLRVVADPPEVFESWLAGQRRSAQPPADSSQARGREVFLGGPCAMCHTIRGTPAGSRVGPDLTHLASRTTLAAATIPNTRGWLAGWVTDPHGIKPGVRMPPNLLAPDDLDALLDYLLSLR